LSKTHQTESVEPVEPLEAEWYVVGECSFDRRRWVILRCPVETCRRQQASLEYRRGEMETCEVCGQRSRIPMPPPRKPEPEPAEFEGRDPSFKNRKVHG
jgi:hypothetical protein